jgi:hypothetical protein
VFAILIDFSPLFYIEPVVLIVGAWHAFKYSQQEKKASLNLHETRLLHLRGSKWIPHPGPSSEIMLRCSGSHHFAAHSPSRARVRAKARETSHHFQTPALAAVSKNARKET